MYIYNSMKRFILTLMTAATVAAVNAQDAREVQTVCPGATMKYHVEAPTDGSDYVWETDPRDAGIIIKNNDEPWNVSVTWQKNGTLSVYEENSAGCTSETAYLEVELGNAISAQFDNAQVCHGDPLNVVFSEGTAFPVVIEFTIDDEPCQADVSQSPYRVPGWGNNYKLTKVTDANKCSVEPQEGNSAVIMPALNKLTIKKAE